MGLVGGGRRSDVAAGQKDRNWVRGVESLGIGMASSHPIREMTNLKIFHVLRHSVATS